MRPSTLNARSLEVGVPFHFIATHSPMKVPATASSSEAGLGLALLTAKRSSKPPGTCGHAPAPKRRSKTLRPTTRKAQPTSKKLAAHRLCMSVTQQKPLTWTGRRRTSQPALHPRILALTCLPSLATSFFLFFLFFFFWFLLIGVITEMVEFI